MKASVAAQARGLLNARRVSKSAHDSQRSRGSTVIVIVGVTVVLVAVTDGGYVARQTVSGHGRWHEAARALYQKKDRAAQTGQAYAAGVPAWRANSPLLSHGDTPGDGRQDWS